MNRKQVAIVGAGPAGMMAAIAATQQGASVTIYEKLNRAGVKLLATGGGRCNLTNTLPLEEFIAAFGRQGRFMRNALHHFSRDNTLAFFHNHQVPTRCIDGFHIFPDSERAQDVKQALEQTCKAANVMFHFKTVIDTLNISNGMLTGIMINEDAIPTDAVILACGGKGYPELGGGASGYTLAQAAGHTIVPPVPGLVGLKTKEAWPGSCAGIVLEGVSLFIDHPKLGKTRKKGDLLFTHDGISGPAAIDLSGSITALLLQESSIPVKCNPFPGRTENSWQEEFNRWAKNSPKKQIHSLLSQLLPKALANCLCETLSAELKHLGIGLITAAEFPKAIRTALARCLTGIPFTITGSAGFDRAMVTRGGVALKQIRPKTLESKLLPGLFFAGEVLDLDGPCGGYNLQWAFSSGALAGSTAGGTP